MNQPNVLTQKGSLPEFQPSEIRNKFLERYKTEPLLVRSPGRINFIGEHTDYNEGFVMPAAIDRDILVAMGYSGESRSTLYSVKHDETLEFDVRHPEKVAFPSWANFLLGVVRQFVDKGYDVKPIHAIIDGNVPTGAGLSSSAALECGFAFALDHLHGFGIPKLDLIHIAQWSEHNYVGVKCGIMDQFSSMMGAAGKAFVLDCRSLTYEYFPLDLQDYAIVLCDTMVKHSLANSAYNTRRAECEKGVSILKAHYPSIQSLRDVTLDMIDAHREEFSSKEYDRCTYVVAENQRVLFAADDLAKGDLASFGQRMYETHDGLSRLYEVSCLELDFLVDEAKKFGGVIGARMMGGGFGGCTINLVQKSRVNEFIETLSNAYRKNIHRDMHAYVVALKDGTSVIPTTAKPSLL